MFTARYQEILNILRQRIESGFYTDRMPPVRALCSEFKVCKSTISKVFEKLAYSGMIRTTRSGTFICGGSENKSVAQRGGIVGIVTGKLTARYREKDDLFLNSIKENLAVHNFSSVLIEVADDDWHNQDFWHRFDLDGFIFIYSSFYRIMEHKITFCAKPRVIGNWLPDEIEEYFVDFGPLAYNVDSMLEGLIARGFKRIALAVNVPSNLTEQVFNRWRKVMRKYKLYNYNSALEDFRYQKDIALRWCSSSVPPEVVLCINVQFEKLIKDMNDCPVPLKIFNVQIKTEGYKHLAEVLVKTFVAVFNGRKNVAKRNLIGEYELNIYDQNK